MVHRLAPQAETDLDDIWYYTASESGSLDTADRLVDSISHRFVLLAAQPHLGRRRDHDLRVGVRSFPVGEYVVLYRIDVEDVFILRVLRGSRDITTLLHD